MTDTDPLKELAETQAAEDKAEAERAGISVEQLQYSRMFDMSPEEYRAYANVKDDDEFRNVQRAFRENRQFDKLVEKVKEKLDAEDA